MSKILENSKFLLDICKKKEYKDRKDNSKYRKDVNEEKDIRNISDLSQNSCLYCEKVFINSKYLLKHVYRRHSDEIIKLHKRCLHSDSNDLKSLITYLEEEFSDLKNELIAVKQAVNHTADEHEIPEESKKESMNPSPLSENPRNAATTDIYIKEIIMFKGKLHDIENKIHCLTEKLEEYDKIISAEVLHKEDIHRHIFLKEEKILRKQEEHFDEMKQVLLRELKKMLDKQLNENNIESKSKLSELKDDILKLDQVIAALKKQIDSPDYLLTLENKLEQQLSNFLGASKHRGTNRNNSKQKKMLSISKNRITHEKNKESKTVDLRNQVTTDKTKHNHVQRNCNQKTNVSRIIPVEVMINKRLSSFGISPNCSKISNSDYVEKLQLINAHKNYLEKLYPNFSEIYNNINFSADHEVSSHLNSKQERKLRFSEPLIVNKDVSHSTNFLNKTCPVLVDKINSIDDNEYPGSLHKSIRKGMSFKEHRFALSEIERYTIAEIPESGDGSANFEEVYENHGTEIFEATPDKVFQTSSPINKNHSTEKTTHISLNTSRIKESTSPCGSSKNPTYSSIEMQGTSHYMLNDYEAHKAYISSLNNKPEFWDESTEMDDLDEKSLKSLSSLEDEENPFNKDALL